MSFLSDCPDFSLLGLLFPHLELPPLPPASLSVRASTGFAVLLIKPVSCVCPQPPSALSIRPYSRHEHTHTHSPASLMPSWLCLYAYLDKYSFFFSSHLLFSGMKENVKRAFGFHYISAAATGTIFRFYQLPKSFRGF